jgi:hypothetical protein
VLGNRPPRRGSAPGHGAAQPTEDGRLLWSERYDRTFADVFAIEEEIARTIVDTLRATSFADLAQPAPKRYTENLKAYGLYLKGRYAWNKRTQEGVTEAIDYFEQAIAEDARYAPAYTGLADSYALQLDYRSVPVAEGFARAEGYARQALELTIRRRGACFARLESVHLRLGLCGGRRNSSAPSSSIPPTRRPTSGTLRSPPMAGSMKRWSRAIPP